MILYILGRAGAAPCFPAYYIAAGRQLMSCSFPKPINAFQVQWDRSIRNSYVSNENLAVSHPRLFKKFQSERAEDKLPTEWDLIYSQGTMRTKISALLWASFAVLCGLPLAAIYCWWEYRDEEDVIFFNQEVRKTTEMFSFIALQGLLFATVYKNCQYMPRRIYYNKSKDIYLAIKPAIIPYISKKVQFRTTDVSVFKPLIPISFKLKGTIYCANNTKFMFPHTYFRSGEDRSFMLRHVNLRRM